MPPPRRRVTVISMDTIWNLVVMKFEPEGQKWPRGPFCALFNCCGGSDLLLVTESNGGDQSSITNLRGTYHERHSNNAPNLNVLRILVNTAIRTLLHKRILWIFALDGIRKVTSGRRA